MGFPFLADNSNHVAALFFMSILSVM